MLIENSGVNKEFSSKEEDILQRSSKKLKNVHEPNVDGNKAKAN